MQRVGSGLAVRSARPRLCGQHARGWRGRHKKAILPVVCTVVVLIRPAHVLLAANRDERLYRPWDPPDAYWPDHPGVVAGRDRTAGGTWMGMNRHGLVATVLNRPGTLGPEEGKRSRGELPLMALDHQTAAAASEAIGRLDASAWRGFNMVLADPSGAFFVRGLGRGQPKAERLQIGVSMVTAYDPNDPHSPRTARNLGRFRTEEPSGSDDWERWLAILADRRGRPAEQINVVPHGGFGTVCSSFVSLPAAGQPIWLFAPGPPHVAGFRPVSLYPVSGDRLGCGLACCDPDTAAITAPPRDL